MTVKLISSDKIARLSKTEVTKYLALVGAGDIQAANDFAESRLQTVRRYINKKDIESGWLIEPEGMKALYLTDEQMLSFNAYVKAYNKSQR